jgi:hypothetical protein
MNIHPIFVHFPIALLLVWSLLQFKKLEVWLPKISWKSVRDILLVVGFAGALAALLTGDIASEIVGETALIETHSTFAIITTVLYGLFVVELMIKLVRPVWKMPALLEKFTALYIKSIEASWLRALLVIAAILGLIVTGLLGGAIVFGTSADPLSGPILRLFGL